MRPRRLGPPIAIAAGVGLTAGALSVAVWGAPLDAAVASVPSASPPLLAMAGAGLLGLAATVGALRRASSGSRRYDRERELSALSQELASARTFDAILAHTARAFAATLRPQRTLLFRRDANGAFRSVGNAAASQQLRLPAALADRIAAGEILVCSRRQRDGGPFSGLWSRIGIEVLVPLPVGGPPVGLLALGPRTSRRPYDDGHLGFLGTAGNQIAMAMINSVAFEQLEDLNQHLARLNENLEHQVGERTAALHASNAELSSSLTMLRTAYRQLEHTQTTLLRAERLATLGRLTSGLAHEMNTPLGAVLNALRMIADLAREYDASIGDPAVLAADHREIAREILSSARAASEWTGKAAAYLRSIKAHSRESDAGGRQRFAVAAVVEDARALVLHRLRAAACELEFGQDDRSIEITGDRGRFGQVLVNLVANAIDAYEERGIRDGRIEIEATRNVAGGLTLRVRDWAGGIPASVLPHIFDELYTTKGPGRGTGLGLWISRNLIEEAFGGTLDVVTGHGGSCFVAEIPETPQTSDEAADGESRAAAPRRPHEEGSADGSAPRPALP